MQDFSELQKMFIHIITLMYTVKVLLNGPLTSPLDVTRHALTGHFIRRKCNSNNTATLP